MATKQTYVQSDFVRFHVYFDGIFVEDVMSYTPPARQYKTTTIESAGMSGDVKVANQTAIEAMDAALAHNNGVNTHLLLTPGVHTVEVRAVRQKYNVVQSRMDYERITWRDRVQHIERDAGNVETGNPYGNTDKFSVYRHEEIINGRQTRLDEVYGKLVTNGVSATDEIDNLLK